MKKIPSFLFAFLLLFISVSFNQTAQSQQVHCNNIHWLYLQIKQGVQIPAQCNCMYFIHSCTGEPALMPGGQARIRCGSGPVRCYDIVSPFDRICNFKGCELGHELKINYGNWDVCGKPYPNSCEVYVSQYLPLNPHFNGQLLGNWPAFSSATFPTDLNNIHSRTKLEFCPGDDALLSFPQMDIPKESGLCLRINVRNEVGGLVTHQIFDYSSIMGTEVNVTSLLSGLSQGGIYKFEFILTCCNTEEALCVFAASSKYTKGVWIELLNDYSFDAQLNQGGGPFSDCDHLALPLEPLPYGPIFDPDCDINLSFFNILNEENETIAITVNRIIDCDIANGLVHIGTFNTILPHNGNYSVPVPKNPGDGCRCYEVVFNYTACGSLIEEKYYYRVGDNCDNPFNGNINKLEQNPIFQNFDNSRIFPNPAGDYVNIEINNNQHNLWTLEIFDSEGNLLKQTLTRFFGIQSEKIPLKLPPGLYIYYLHQSDESHHGKFIVK